MPRKPFFKLGKLKLKYHIVGRREKETVEEVPLPRKITLFLKRAGSPNGGLLIRVGDRVRTGQKLLSMGEGGYLISTVTGTVSAISEHTGYFGQTYPAVSIEPVEEDLWDDTTTRTAKEPTVENALRFWGSLPGEPDIESLLKNHPPLDTIVINGMDKDLLITTNQLTVKTETTALTEGIGYLKKLTKADKFILLVPSTLKSVSEQTGAEIRVLEPVFPDALPKLIMKKVLGKVVLPGGRCENSGVGFIDAETVVALSKAFSKGEVCVNKTLTVIKKDNTRINVKARIGTPVKDILEHLHIETVRGDRVVFGGPMFGHAIHSEDLPISYDTDAVMIQDKGQIVWNSDVHCVNCGECVRACPAEIPVNMLVRLLENGLYEEAAKEYDLLSCIECGLCSYVCIGRIPVFHHIMLGKQEYDRLRSAEESHG
jgi:H+/Na+-translocating ferredoxin:NAD+ oxidoreductase subunit C